MREWRALNPEKVKKSKKPLTEKQKACQKLRQQEWYEKNKATILIDRAQYRKDNPEKIRLYKAKQRKIPHNHFRHALAERIRSAVRAKGVKKLHGTERLLGCAIPFFMGYLEQKFKPGMNWSNHGDWHIDHVLPCASFDLSLESEQLRCFHYTNLQPLWKLENLSKSDKIRFVVKP